MKRWFSLVLCLLMLSGCGKESGDREQAISFRTALMEAGGCSFSSVICADYGDRVYEFGVQCHFTVEDGAVLTVTSPEEIAGITAQVSEEGAGLSFEDVQLEFGQMANGHVAPMALPWLLGSGWTGAYLESAVEDGEYLRVTFLMGYEEDQITLVTWLDENSLPVQCEVIYDGSRCLTAAIDEFQFD